MSGGTNNIKKPSHGPEGGPGIGGQYPMTPPQMVTGGPYGPGPGGVPPQWGQGGQPQPNQQFGGWNPGQGQLQNQLGGLLGGGQQPQRRFPGMNIPGLIAGGGQPGQNMPPGFPAYDNLPENWQDGGYDPNAQQLPPKRYV